MTVLRESRSDSRRKCSRPTATRFASSTRTIPLPNHSEAFKAAEAAHCAGDQGKYWEMHDAMFADMRALFVPSLKQTARKLGLDGATFERASIPASTPRISGPTSRTATRSA